MCLPTRCKIYSAVSATDVGRHFGGLGFDQAPAGHDDRPGVGGRGCRRRRRRRSRSVDIQRRRLADLATEALRRASAGELLPTETSARARQLQHARRTAQRQIERLVDAYTAEALPLDELQTRRAGLEERLRLLSQQEQALQRQHHQNLRLAELCANVETLCHATRTGLHALDFAGRRRIVELLVDRVLISHETVEIRYAIPLTGLGHHDKKGLYNCLIEATFCQDKQALGLVKRRQRKWEAQQVVLLLDA